MSSRRGRGKNLCKPPQLDRTSRAHQELGPKNSISTPALPLMCKEVSAELDDMAGALSTLLSDDLAIRLVTGHGPSVRRHR